MRTIINTFHGWRNIFRGKKKKQKTHLVWGISKKKKKKKKKKKTRNGIVRIKQNTPLLNRRDDGDGVREEGNGAEQKR